MKQYKNIIIAGGGTAGHIFPAISIANALKKIDNTINILFVGAKNKMEMERIPAAGYKIVPLPISGLQRRLSLQNLLLPFKILISIAKSYKIINSFKPDVVVGAGGYASFPIIYAATKKQIPSLILEQNSYPGLTNKLLAKKVNKICVAHQQMEKFFPIEKIILTGNPVREDLFNVKNKKAEALEYFKLPALQTGNQKNKKTLLVIGGSLGARTINQSICNNLDQIVKNKIQLLWQTGKTFYETASTELSRYDVINIKIFDFITRMDLAYAIADVVIARAGAITISELCIVGKPAILVPSPNVAEDHQTKNAMTLIKNNAALIVEDTQANEKLVQQAIILLNDDIRTKILSDNISKLAIKNSAEIIADQIMNLIEKE